MTVAPILLKVCARVSIPSAAASGLQRTLTTSHLVVPAERRRESSHVPSSIKLPPYLNPSWNSRKKGPIINDKPSIAGITSACRLARYVLDTAASFIKVGTTTEYLDDIVHDTIISAGAYPSPLGYGGFPKSCCTSVNNVACHGIPDSRPLEDGDIVNLDVTVYLDGFHGDVSDTYSVGSVSDLATRLQQATVECRDEAIRICRPGVRINAIGDTISSVATKRGFEVVPHFCGHGIGKDFHEFPDIIHIPNSDETLMREGMVFTIEPILTAGKAEVLLLDDGWTAVTADKQVTAQCEHTLLVTKSGYSVLTLGRNDKNLEGVSWLYTNKT